MKDVAAIKYALNNQLTSLLEEKICTAGKFTCAREGNGVNIVFYGTSPGRPSPFYFWDPSFLLQRLVWDYLEGFDPALATFSIDIQLDTNTFYYQHTSPAQRAVQQIAEQEQQEQDTRERLLKLKVQLQSDTAPFGADLATRVADKIQSSGFFGHSHRDYCGTGFEYRAGEGYRYGELWDGGIVKPMNSFPDKPAFIGWLALQSNASMSMTESPEPFYWGNQTVTRHRMQEFIAGY